MTTKQLLAQGPTMATVRKGRTFDFARIEFRDTQTRERWDALREAMDARRTAIKAAHRRHNRRVGAPLRWTKVA